MPDTAPPEKTDIPAFLRRLRNHDAVQAAPARDGHQRDGQQDHHAETLRGMIEDATYARDQSQQDERDARLRAAALSEARRHLTPGGALCNRLGSMIQTQRLRGDAADVATSTHGLSLRDLQAALALVLAANGDVEF